MNNNFKKQNKKEGCQKSTLADKAAEFIKNNIEGIAYRTSLKIYQDILSYTKGSMPKKESQEASIHLLSQIVSHLQQDQRSHLDKDSVIKEAVKFEESIAHKRVQYRIDLIDVLRGMNILRIMLWDALNKEFSQEHIIRSEEFFDLERRINNIFLRYFIDIAEAYLKLHQEVIASQESAFEKWEEVVKSAHKIELNIPCREAFAAIARLQAEAIAVRLGFNEEKVQDVKVAVGEACSNAIEHGVSRRGIDITYETSLDFLKVTVRDYGPGFEYKEGTLPADPLSERGRGLFLMKALTDEVVFHSKLGEGTMVALLKKR